MPEFTEIVLGYGHNNIKATHHATIEFTRDKHLSEKGDCIIVVATDKGLGDLNPEFRNILKNPNAKLKVKIEADGISDEIKATGSPALTLSHPREMVLRKSNYISERTLGLQANKSANELNRELVKKLQNPKQQARVTLTVYV